MRRASNLSTGHSLCVFPQPSEFPSNVGQNHDGQDPHQGFPSGHVWTISTIQRPACNGRRKRIVVKTFGGNDVVNGAHYLGLSVRPFRDLSFLGRIGFSSRGSVLLRPQSHPRNSSVLEMDDADRAVPFSLFAEISAAYSVRGASLGFARWPVTISR
jgi:hypothetical protein